MSDLNYAYAVARIRVLEKYLLSGSDIEQMISLPDDEAVLAFLKDRGWGDDTNPRQSAEDVLSEESAKTKALMRELKVEPEIRRADVKAALKNGTLHTEHAHLEERQNIQIR